MSDHTIVNYLGHEDLFCTVLLCILATSSYYLLLLLGHTISVHYRAHLCIKYSLGICNFLEEISSLSHSVVFLSFFALIAEQGFLISSCYSLELCIQMLIYSLSPLLFTSLLFTAICKAASDSHFAFFAFLFHGEGLDPCLLYNVMNLHP